MKLCYRTAANLMRSWSFRSRHSSSVTSEGVDNVDDQHSEIERGVLIRLIKHFSTSTTIRNVAKEHLLTGTAYTKALKSFKAHLLSQSHPELLKTVHNILHGGGHVDSLLPHFLEHARRKNPLVGPVLELTQTSNLSNPTNWYPWARALNRHLYYHAGPTNSGKTHSAIECFKSAKSGIYCAPLRMLAHEIFHRCNKEGIPCDLLTGEEVQFASDDEGSPAPHLACTVEMAYVSQDHVYDVAVVDEMQMIEDLQRGGAWTRALLGLPAKEVHVCGHSCAVGLVQRLANVMGERFEVKHYKRLVPLVVEKRGLAGSYKAVKPGDCVIVFSRKKVFEIRKRIETATRQKCAVIYGNLPPATRVQQAQLFNDPDSDCGIMVATDAVGMGLNLNIKRIVFHTLEKFDGEEVSVLSSAHAKQIAGRAGRFGMDHSRGSVTTFHDKDLPLLRQLITAPVPKAKQAGLYPSTEQIKLFSSHLPCAKLPDILRMFMKMAQVDGNYFLCNMDDQMTVASKLNIISMPLMDHFCFSMAPVDVSTPSQVSVLKQFAELYASGKPVTFVDIKKVLNLKGKLKIASSVHGLARLEEQHDIIDVYLWLSMRFPDSFVDAERVGELQGNIEEAIADSLLSTKLQVPSKDERLQLKLKELQNMLQYGHKLSKVQKKALIEHFFKERRKKKSRRRTRQ